MFNPFLSFGGDWNWLGLIKTKKVIKRAFLAFLEFLTRRILVQKLFRNSQSPSYRSTCVKHLHVRVGVAASRVAEEHTSRFGQRV